MKGEPLGCHVKFWLHLHLWGSSYLIYISDSTFLRVMLEHVVGNILNRVLWLVLHELAQGLQKKGHYLCLKVGSHGQLALKRRSGEHL